MSCMIQFRETFWLSRNNQLKNDRILNALAADIELFFHLFSLVVVLNVKVFLEGGKKYRKKNVFARQAHRLTGRKASDMRRNKLLFKKKTTLKS